MRYHSPDRPRDSQGWGRIVAPNGATLGPLQALIVEPMDEGDWEVRVHLQVGSNAFREHSCRLELLSAVTELLFRYECDPEGVLAEYFHYDFTMAAASPRLASKTHKAQTTLEDLGLL